MNLFDLIWSDLIWSDLISSDLISSNLISSHLISSHLISSHLIQYNTIQYNKIQYDTIPSYPIWKYTLEYSGNWFRYCKHNLKVIWMFIRDTWPLRVRNIMYAISVSTNKTAWPGMKKSKRYLELIAVVLIHQMLSRLPWQLFLLFVPGFLSYSLIKLHLWYLSGCVTSKHFQLQTVSFSLGIMHSHSQR